jgi:hypothetical protein
LIWATGATWLFQKRNCLYSDIISRASGLALGSGSEGLGRGRGKGVEGTGCSDLDQASTSLPVEEDGEITRQGPYSGSGAIKKAVSRAIWLACP